MSLKGFYILSDGDVVFYLAEGATKSWSSSRVEHVSKHAVQQNLFVIGRRGVFFHLAGGATKSCPSSLVKRFSKNVFISILDFVDTATWSFV